MKQISSLLTISIACFLVACGAKVGDDSSVDENEQSPLPLLVSTQQGDVQGVMSDEVDTVRVFKGLPYAAPPVGDLRWQAPQPPELWEGARDASAFSPECAQIPLEELSFYATGPTPQSEDCLYLNIWSSQEPTDEPRPVMVWIHGGAFLLGSGSLSLYDGSRLAEKGAVVVTINYRLYIYGFFAHPDLASESRHGISGNQGLYDQIAALQWVQRNIAAFNGDPNNVTIFGESAGSMSVCYLTATPLTEGLFHKAIGQSGGCFVDHAGLDFTVPTLPIEPDPQPGAPRPLVGSGYEVGEAVASLLVPDSDDPIRDLRIIPAEEFPQQLADAQVALPWRAIYVDGHMFPDQMRLLYESGRSNAVPAIVGSTRDEGTTLFPTFEELTTEAWVERMRSRLPGNHDSLISQYLADAKVSTRDTQQRFISDYLFAGEMRTWARLNERLGLNSYLYVFSHAPSIPDLDRSLGAFHAGEIGYVFGNRFVPLNDGTQGEHWNESDEKVQALISQYWYNFAARGDPNAVGLPEWPTYQSESDLLIDLTATPTTVQGYLHDKLDAWEEYLASISMTSSLSMVE